MLAIDNTKDDVGKNNSQNNNENKIVNKGSNPVEKKDADEKLDEKLNKSETDSKDNIDAKNGKNKTNDSKNNKEDDKFLNTDIYNESMFDPLVYNVRFANKEKLTQLKQIEGYFADHESKHVSKKLKTYGDISLVIYNMYRSIQIIGEEHDDVENVVELIDTVHPTIIAIQAINKPRLEVLLKVLTKIDHYGIINDDRSATDYLSNNQMFLPILYDKNIVKITKSGYFNTDEKYSRVYGSFVEIQDKRLGKDSVDYTIINVDLYSSFPQIVSAMFFNIINDVSTANYISTKPIFILGNIGSMSDSVEKIINISYKNLLSLDMNNKRLNRTTDHTNGNHDNIERDFILLHDTENVFTVNYARILRRFTKGNHYPVHAILSLQDLERKDDENSSGSNKNKGSIFAGIGSKLKAIFNKGISGACKGGSCDIDKKNNRRRDKHKKDRKNMGSFDMDIHREGDDEDDKSNDRDNEDPISGEKDNKLNDGNDIPDKKDKSGENEEGADVDGKNNVMSDNDKSGEADNLNEGNNIPEDNDESLGKKTGVEDLGDTNGILGNEDNTNNIDGKEVDTVDNKDKLDVDDNTGESNTINNIIGDIEKGGKTGENEDIINDLNDENHVRSIDDKSKENIQDLNNKNGNVGDNDKKGAKQAVEDLNDETGDKKAVKETIDKTDATGNNKNNINSVLGDDNKSGKSNTSSGTNDETNVLGDNDKSGEIDKIIDGQETSKSTNGNSGVNKNVKDLNGKDDTMQKKSVGTQINTNKNNDQHHIVDDKGNVVNKNITDDDLKSTESHTKIKSDGTRITVRTSKDQNKSTNVSTEVTDKDNIESNKNNKNPVPDTINKPSDESVKQTASSTNNTSGDKLIKKPENNTSDISTDRPALKTYSNTIDKSNVQNRPKMATSSLKGLTIQKTNSFSIPSKHKPNNSEITIRYVKNNVPIDPPYNISRTVDFNPSHYLKDFKHLHPKTTISVKQMDPGAKSLDSSNGDAAKDPKTNNKSFTFPNPTMTKEELERHDITQNDRKNKSTISKTSRTIPDKNSTQINVEDESTIESEPDNSAKTKLVQDNKPENENPVDDSKVQALL